MAQIGLPYVWGGDGPTNGDAGFDCSGLTTFSYAAARVSLPRTAHTQYYKGPHVPQGAALQPGDLVFYGTPAKVHHVGMYLGDGKMINAPTFGKPVQTAFYRWGGDDYLGATRPAATGQTTSGLLPYAPAAPSTGTQETFPAPVAPAPTAVPNATAPQPAEAVSAAAATAAAATTAAATTAAVTTVTVTVAPTTPTTPTTPSTSVVPTTSSPKTSTSTKTSTPTSTKTSTTTTTTKPVEESSSAPADPSTSDSATNRLTPRRMSSSPRRLRLPDDTASGGDQGRSGPPWTRRTGAPARMVRGISATVSTASNSRDSSTSEAGESSSTV